MTLRLPETRGNKFHAKRTEVDGHVFDSRKEASRFVELRYLEKAGLIRGLVLQPKFTLGTANSTTGEWTDIGIWRGDFAYQEYDTAGKLLACIVEDVKGGTATLTPIARWKLKHVQAQYGITVKLT